MDGAAVQGYGNTNEEIARFRRDHPDLCRSVRHRPAQEVTFDPLSSDIADEQRGGSVMFNSTDLVLELGGVIVEDPDDEELDERDIGEHLELRYYQCA